MTTEILDYLDEREATILGLRLCGFTLQETANVFGLSKERVRQIEAKAWVNIQYRWRRRNYKTKEEIMKLLHS